MSRASSKQQPGWRGLAVLCVVVVAVGAGSERAGSAPADLVCDWSSAFGEELAAIRGPSDLVVGDLGDGQKVYTNYASWDGVQCELFSGTASGNTSPVAIFDDGSGPALYRGGSTIDRWDGESWSALVGPSGTGTDGEVLALAVHDDGRGPALFVGGMFTHAGGIEALRVARWDGSEWSTLTGPTGNGTSSYVYALAEFDDGSGLALYAGGLFKRAGGVTVNGVARWDGSAWSALGSGVIGVGGRARSWP